VPHAYSHLIRSADFNNYPKMQDKEPEDGDTEKAIVEEEEEGGKGGRKGLSKSDGTTRRALVSEKLHSPSFKLFWCCIKGEHLWCFISPRSPHPHTSIRLSSGIALKVCIIMIPQSIPTHSHLFIFFRWCIDIVIKLMPR